MIKDLIQTIKPASLLDIGCGDGGYTKEISQYCKKVIAIEPEALFLNIAKRENTKDNITYKQMSGDSLEFADNSFDTVIARKILHHSKTWQKIIKEAVRVSSGLVLLEEPIDVLDSQEKLNTKAGRDLYMELQKEIGYPHFAHFQPQELFGVLDKLQLQYSHEITAAKKLSCFTEFFANFELFVAKSKRQEYWRSKLREFKHHYAGKQFSDDDVLFIRISKG